MRSVVTNLSSATIWYKTLPILLAVVAFFGISTVTYGQITVTADQSPVCSGENAVLRITDDGLNATYTWETSPNGVDNWQIVPGEVLDELTIAITELTFFRATGNTDFEVSNIESVAVISSVGGTASVDNVTQCVTDTDIELTLADHIGDIQWQVNIDGGGYNDIVGATTTPFTYTHGGAGSYAFQAVVTNSTCASATSSEATTVVEPESVGGIASVDNATQCVTDTDIELTLVGHTGDIQWQVNIDGGGYSDIAGATTTPYTYTHGGADSYAFQAVVTNSTCTAATSNEATTVVEPESAGGSASVDNVTQCVTDTDIELTLADHTGDIQWQVNIDGGGYNDIAGATTTPFIYTHGGVGSHAFQAIVTNGNCASATSSEATTEVEPESVGGTASVDNATQCVTDTDIELTLAGHTGDIQWQVNIDGGGYNDIVGATTTPFTYSHGGAGSYAFQAIVTNSTCASATSSEATTEVEPESVGGTASVDDATQCVTDTDIELTLASHIGDIQWQVNIDGGGYNDIVGATTTPFTYTHGGVGSYTFQAIVTNGTCAAATSSEATTEVEGQPVGGTASVDNATQCATDTDIALTLAGHEGSIQWRVNIAGAGYNNIAGATTTPFTYTHPGAGSYAFQASVINSCATVMSSEATTLVEAESAGGTASVDNPTQCITDTDIELTVAGHTGDIQWQVNVDGGGYNDIAGATATPFTYTHGGVGSYAFQAIVTNGTCAAATSSEATTEVEGQPVGGTASVDNATQCATDTDIELTLADHEGSIQWQVNIAGAGYNDIAGATATPFTFTHSGAGSYAFQALVTNSCATVMSSEATTLVEAESVGGTASVDNATQCVTDTDIELTLSSHTGDIQWQVNIDGGGYNDIAGAITTPFIYTHGGVGSYAFQAIVTNGTCAAETSSEATAEVGQESVGGESSVDNTLQCTTDFDIQLALVNHTGDIQWQVNIDGNGYNDIAGATANPFNYTHAGPGNYAFQAIVTNGACVGVMSTESTTVVEGQPVGGTSAVDETVLCESDTDIRLSLTGHNGNIQWQVNIDGSGFNTIADATVTPYDYNHTGAGSYAFQAVLSNGCGAVLSASSTATVEPLSVGGNASVDNATQCDTDLDVVLTLVNHTGDIQWQVNIDGAGYNDIVGATTNPFTYSHTGTGSYAFQAVVTNGTCAAEMSSEATTEVEDAPTGGTATVDNATQCVTDTDVELTLAGHDGAIQWQVNIDGGGYNDIAGATTTPFTYTHGGSGNYAFQAIVTNSCGSSTSTEATTDVGEESIGGTASVDNTVQCATDADIELMLVDHLGSVQWQVNIDGGGYNDIVGATTATYVYTHTGAGTYAFQAVVANGDCVEAMSSEATTVVESESEAGAADANGAEAGVDITICEGGEATITLDGNQVGDVLRWQFRNSTTTNWDPYLEDGNTVTASSIQPTNITEATDYRVVVRNGTCAVDRSQFATVMVETKPLAGTADANGANAGEDVTICEDGDVEITLVGYSNDATIQWQSSPAGANNFSDILNETSDVLMVTSLNASTDYRALVSRGLCSNEESGIATVTVEANPAGQADANGDDTDNIFNQSYCGPSDATILLEDYAAGATIQWQSSLDGVSYTDLVDALGDVMGATTDMLTIVGLADTTWFRALVTTAISCTDVPSGVCQVFIDAETSAGVPDANISASGNGLGRDTTICAGNNAMITHRATSSGTIRGSILGWQFRNNSTSNNWTPYEEGGVEVTTSVINPTNITEETHYRLRVQNGACPAKNSSRNAKVFLYDPVTEVYDVTACNEYFWAEGTQATYTQSQDGIEHTRLGANGECDTLMVLNLTIINNPTKDTSAVACQSFTWRGTTYNTSGTYTKQVPSSNAGECDTTITLELIIGDGPVSSTDVQTACDGFTWIDGNTYTMDNNTATHTLTTSGGCDSVVTLDLTMRYSTSGVDVQIGCMSYTWIDGVTYTTDNNTATHVLINRAGCDSVVTLNLTITDGDEFNETATGCGSYFWEVTNQTLTQSGVYTAEFTGTHGCDSNYTLNLTIGNDNSSSETVEACDSYTWPANGVTYTNTGTYTATLTNATGCDSVVTLGLTIFDDGIEATRDTFATACGSFIWRGQTYTATGSYTQTGKNDAGCDEEVTLQLTLSQPTASTTAETACDSFFWRANGETYFTSGTHTATLTNANGCDSVVTLNLTILQATSSAEAITACNSFLWELNGEVYTNSGVYTTVVSNAAGCDSTITLELEVLSTASGADCDEFDCVPVGSLSVTAPYQQSFDNMPVTDENCANSANLTEGWENCPNDNLDWDVDNGGTPSFLTGPGSDVTGGNYLYVDATCNNSTAVMFSPAITIPTNEVYELTMKYHMRGGDAGVLKVHVVDGEDQTLVFSTTGNQGNQWNTMQAALADYAGKSIVVKVTASTLNGERGDIAIDDFNILPEGGIADPCVDFQVQATMTPASRFWISDGTAEATVIGSPSIDISYRWNTGQTARQLSGLRYGVYYVTATAASCTAEGRVVVAAGGILGGIFTRLADLFGKDAAAALMMNPNEFKAFPNPSNGAVNVFVPQAFNNAYYSVMDVGSGREWQRGVVQNGVHAIDLTHLAAGVYVVVFDNGAARESVNVAIVK